MKKRTVLITSTTVLTATVKIGNKNKRIHDNYNNNHHKNNYGNNNNHSNNNDNNNYIMTKPRTVITSVNKKLIYSTYPMFIF